VAGAAAADATLEILENEPIIKTINKRGKVLMSGIDEILSDADIPHAVLGVPTMFGIIMGTNAEPHDFRGYLAGDGELYEKIAMKLIENGAQPDGDGREPWFMSYSHSEKDVADTLTMFEDAVKTAK
jgi:glutamate-1-semialdehyde 2,1-aminomutase